MKLVHNDNMDGYLLKCHKYRDGGIEVRQSLRKVNSERDWIGLALLVVD